MFKKKEPDLDPRFLHRFGMYIHSAPHPSMAFKADDFSSSVKPFTCLYCSTMHGSIRVTLALEAPIETGPGKYIWPGEFGQFGSCSCRDGYLLETRHLNIANLIPINRIADRLRYGVKEAVKQAPDPALLEIFSTGCRRMSVSDFHSRLTYPNHAPDLASHDIRMKELYEVVQLLTWPGPCAITVPPAAEQKNSNTVSPIASGMHDSSAYTLDKYYTTGTDDPSRADTQDGASVISEEQTSAPFESF